MNRETTVSAEEEGPEADVGPQLSTEDVSSRPWNHHFRRPVERPFTAQERDHVTILFGGLTWKHERLIQAAFQACGYRFQSLPNPTLSSYHLGRRFGNPGQCNPTYFTVGNLIRYLRELESPGLSKQEILDRYVFFTAGSCGPCRFGMYESEYRMALESAGFGGFRVLLFSQNDGLKAQSGEPGLKFSVDLGMGTMNALNLGDVTNEIAYQLRPYEMVSGSTDRALDRIAEELSEFLRTRPVFEILERSPHWRIIEGSGTPYFCFKDLDENKPVASIRLRVETIDYFLKSYRDEMARRKGGASYSPEDQDDSERNPLITGVDTGFIDAPERGVQPF